VATARVQLTFIDAFVDVRLYRRAISGGEFLLNRSYATDKDHAPELISNFIGVMPARNVGSATNSSHPLSKDERREVAGLCQMRVPLIDTEGTFALLRSCHSQTVTSDRMGHVGTTFDISVVPLQPNPEYTPRPVSVAWRMAN
jgi:hypothetical protein